MQVPKHLYLFASQYLDLGGIRCHYLDEGKGDPVVMVHGNPTWSFYYRNLILALRPTHRCIAIDHVGCGMSDKPSARHYDFSLRRRIDDLEALLEHLQLRENITLVLHDWGGMIGMGYAVRHPERVKRFVILNTGAFHLPKSKPFPMALWLGRNTWLGALLITRLNLFCRAAAWVGTKRKKLADDVRQGLLAPYDSPAHRLAVLKFVQSIPLKPSDAGYDLVSEIECGLEQFRNRPMLIAWGLKDFVFDRHFLDEWLRRFPEAEVMRFEDCGHYILEDAADEIIGRVRQFVAG
jgi:haloalkane dehalogenase